MLKCVPHVQHDYVSSFNQSDHCFLVSSLPKSLHKLSSCEVLTTTPACSSNSFILCLCIKLSFLTLESLFIKQATLLSHGRILNWNTGTEHFSYKDSGLDQTIFIPIVSSRKKDTCKCTSVNTSLRGKLSLPLAVLRSKSTSLA